MSHVVVANQRNQESFRYNLCHKWLSIISSKEWHDYAMSSVGVAYSIKRISREQARRFIKLGILPDKFIKA